MIPTIITQALKEKEIHLGSIHPTRDFLYVADTVRGLMRCAEVEGLEGTVLNLGTGTETSIAVVTELILRELGVEASVASASERIRPDRSEVQRLVADATKASSLLGWSPTVGLSEGLKMTIEWIARWSGSYKPSIYNV